MPEVEATTESQPQESTEYVSQIDQIANETSADISPEPSAEAEGGETVEEAVSDSEGTVESDGQEEGADGALPRPLADLNLSSEELAEFRKRYPSAFAPNAAEDIIWLARDRVIDAREIRKGQLEDADEPTVEEPEQAAAPLDPTKQAEQYQAHISNIVKGYVDPKAVTALGQKLMGRVGWNLKELNNPNLSPEDKAALQQAANEAVEMGNDLAYGAVDIVNSALPAMLLTPQADGQTLLDRIIEHQYPEFGKMHETAMYGRTWEKTKASDPEFAGLPSFSDPKFRPAMEAAAAKVAGSVERFDRMVLTGKDGRPLPKFKQAEEKYSLLAKAMTGQKVSPAQIAQVQVAVEAGKQAQRRTEQKRAAGKALGAGQSKGQLNSTPSGNSDIFGDGVAEFNRQHGRL